MLKTIPLKSMKVNDISKLFTTFNHLVKPFGLPLFELLILKPDGCKRQANRRNHF